MAKGGFSLIIAGFRELDDVVKKVGEAANVGAQKGAEKAAKLLAKNISAFIPRGPTGNLQAALTVDDIGPGGKRRRSARKHNPKLPAAYVWMDATIAPHAYMVEFGTVKSPPRPYFRRAIDGGASAALGELARATSQELNKL